MAAMRNANQSARPHIFGAAALHYRQGSAVANTETPPTWSPEMASDGSFPYTLTEYKRDVKRWVGATKVAQDRQACLVALAIGGAARRVIDEIDDNILMNGMDGDLGDGLGAQHHSWLKCLFHALEQKFPDNPGSVRMVMR